MQSLARQGFTSEQVRAALHAPSRILSFRYELVDRQNQKLRDLTNVQSGSVEYNAFGEIKRTAKFTILDDGNIDFLAHRIRPFARLWVSQNGGGWAEFPLGVFILATPERKDQATGGIIREIEAYDLLYVLANYKFDTRYTAAEGTNYIEAIQSVYDLVGLKQQNLTPTDKVLPAPMDWKPGVSALTVVNDLHRSVNYKSATVDEMGFVLAQPYMSPTVRAHEYEYSDDDRSVIFPEIRQQIDYFKVPNKWIRVVSEADRPPLISVYVNNDPSSPTSYVNRGYYVTDFQDGLNAADQETLDAITQKDAAEALQVVEQTEFESAIMPMHGDSDLLKLTYSRLGISANYLESGWSFDLKAGARMRHEVRRVVSV